VVTEAIEISGVNRKRFPRRPSERGPEHTAIDDVLELAHVAGPVTVLQAPERVDREPSRGQPQPPGGRAGKVARQHGNVLTPFAQRRHVQRERGETMVEVRAKAAGLHLAVEPPVRGCDHTHVDAMHAIAADPLDLALLHGAQQLRLDLR
jgi:hypothetical protein